MLDILESLLAPLARILVRRGVLFPEFAEGMKRYYLRAAEAQGEGRPTDSRLSVLTGLQRRDIARLRSLPPKPARENHLVTLVAHWQTKPGYLDDAGQPIVLQKNGPAPSFEALAQSIRKDIHARTMLDALLENETVTIDADSQLLRLEKRSYQPLSGSDDQIAYLAQNLGDHIAAATENVLSDAQETPHFERAVHYTGLHDDDIAILRERHQDLQMEVLEELNHMAAKLKDAHSGAGTRRFRAGGYFYEAEQ